MRRIPRILLIFAGLTALCFSFLAFTVWVKPFLKTSATKQLSILLKQTDLRVHYQDISVIWGGFRIEGLDFSSSAYRAFGTVEVHLKLWPGKGFGRPDRITLDRMRIAVTRSQLASVNDVRSPSKPSAPNKMPTPLLTRLQSLLQLGVNLELKRVRLEVMDAQKLAVLRVNRLDAFLSATEQIMEIKLQGFRYRDKELLQGLDGQLILHAQQGRLPFFVTAREQGSEPWQVQGSVSEDLDSLELRHKRVGLPLSWRPLLHSIEPQDRIELLLKVQVDGLKRAQDLDFDVQIASNNLEINHPLLSSEKVGPWPFTIRAQGNFSPERGSFEVRRGVFYVMQNAQSALVKSRFTMSKNDLLRPMTQDPWKMSWQLPETDCQAFLKILPPTAFPLLHGFELSGTVQLAAEIELMPQSGRAIEFPSQRQNFACKIARAPQIFSKDWIKQRVSLPSTEFMLQNPSFRAFLSTDYQPIRNISEDFLRGIVAAEDASFWQHEGVRTSALTAALQANLKAGKVLFGGSTITMQMVKNLYLNHEKVLSRKLQELFVSWAIEQTLDKQDIIEIYANIIEFGPGIFGIRQASQAYFTKEPSQLTTAESLFLASLLPSPGRAYRESYCSGQLTEDMQQRMLKVATGLASMRPSEPMLGLYQESLKRLQFQGRGRCPSDLRFTRSRIPQNRKPF